MRLDQSIGTGSLKQEQTQQKSKQSDPHDDDEAVQIARSATLSLSENAFSTFGQTNHQIQYLPSQIDKFDIAINAIRSV